MTAFLAAAVALLAGCATALPPPSKLPFADLPYVQGSGCINCVPSVYNLETAGKYCARMDAIAVVKVPPDGLYEAGKPIGFSCARPGDPPAQPINFNITAGGKH